MKIKVQILFAFVLTGTLVLTSCKKNPPAKLNIKEKSITENEDGSRRVSLNITEDQIKVWNEDAERILQHRYKTHGKESQASIENERWYHQYIAKGSNIQQAQGGMWIDFYPDLTYDYGTEGLVLGKGRYHYNYKNSMLLLVDDDKKNKPQEYQAMIKGSSLVLVGQTTYRDNHLQMKLEQYYAPKEHNHDHD